MKEIILNVKGMVCGGCEKRVQNALSTIEGVENVVANHDSGIVKVTLKEDIDAKILSEKVEDIGFEVEKED